MNPKALSWRVRLRRLAQIIADSQVDSACSECRERLPYYVDAEIIGQDAALLYPDVRQHLEACLDCQRLYADQLDVARREANNELPELVPQSRFDLSFLPQRSRAFAQMVYDSVEQIVRMAKPEHLPELAIIRERLIEAFSGLIDVLSFPKADQAATVPALAFTDEIPAARWAKATFIGLQGVRSTSTRTEIERLKAGGELEQFLLAIAQDAARQAGLGRQEAHRFSSAFAQLHSGERWQELISWVASDQG